MNDLFDKMVGLDSIDYLIDSPRLYNIVYKELWDYSERSREVFSLTSGRENLLSLACGTGLLTRELENKFDRTIGIDINTSMLNIAKRECSSSEFVKKDVIDSIDCEENFDVVTLLGNTSCMFSDAQLERLFGNVSDILREDGDFLVDYATNKKHIEKNIKIELGETTILRNCSTKENNELLNCNFTYKIDSGEEVKTFREKFSIKLRSENQIKNILERTDLNQKRNFCSSNKNHPKITVSEL